MRCRVERRVKRRMRRGVEGGVRPGRGSRLGLRPGCGVEDVPRMRLGLPLGVGSLDGMRTRRRVEDRAGARSRVLALSVVAGMEERRVAGT